MSESLSSVKKTLFVLCLQKTTVYAALISGEPWLCPRVVLRR
jgi:hypothetical protein